MTRAEFSTGLKAVGMSRADFARHVGIHPATVYHWGGPGKPFPQWATMLLAAWLDNMRLSHKYRDAAAMIAWIDGYQSAMNGAITP